MFELLDVDALVRRRAVEAVILDGAGLYALRERLLDDGDGFVRAAAAERLARAARAVFDDARPTRREATQWWLEALDDTLPSVRELVCRAVARHGDRDARLEARLGELLDRDRSWRVRRAAARALAAVAGADAIAALVAALEDPFWRVRQAILEALSLIVTRSSRDESERAGLRATVLAAGAELDESARAALAYLAGGWPEGEDDVPAVLGIIRDPGAGLELSDPDPAVVTARLLGARWVAPEQLVPLLAESHVPLREEAARRLAAVEDVSALLPALGWLEDPRLPNAPAALADVLRRLGSRAEPLAAHALVHGRPGALTWAATWVGTYAAPHLHASLLAWVEHPRDDVRAAVVAAIGQLLGRGPSAQLQGLLRRALDDRSERVRDAAALAVLELGCADEIGAGLDRFGPHVRARVLLASGDVVQARAVLANDAAHARVRVAAVQVGLAVGDAISIDASLADADPWLRREAIERDVLAAAALVRGHGSAEQDPSVRRMAARVLVRERAGLDACERASLRARLMSADAPWLRARGAELVDPSACDDAALIDLLAATRDATAMVRAAASAVLDRVPDLPARLDALLGAAPPISIAAWSRLITSLEPEVARARLDAALADTADAIVHAHLRELAVLFGAEPPRVEVIEGRETRSRPVISPPNLGRPLGQSGLSVAPLIVSGRFSPALASLDHAIERGVDTLFWEPRYTTVTRFLRQSSHAAVQVIAGSFHADRASLTHDLELTRKRLQRDTIDLFLLFWVRSAARLGPEALDALREFQARGWIRSYGFSTHDRAIGVAAIETGDWPVIMTRHSAAHDGAERELLPAAAAAGVGVLGFSALCYGRMLDGSSVLPSGPSAAECYRYSLSQPAVTACISAPQTHRELLENLAVLDDPRLDAERQDVLRAHGREVYADNVRFNRLLRRGGAAPLREAILELFDRADEHVQDG